MRLTVILPVVASSLLAGCCAHVTGSSAASDVDPFLPLFESSPEESLELQTLQVEDGGTIPSWLKGRFIRNVPGRFGMGKRNFTMAFDGYGKIYEWRLTGSEKEVQFKTRYMETRWYNASRKQNDIAAAILFGPTEPPLPFQDHLMQLFAASDNRNVNVWKFGEKLAAIADMDNSVELGVEDLSVSADEYLHFKNKIDTTGRGLACAHPQLRPRKSGVAGESNPNLEAWKEAETINYYCVPNPMGKTDCNVISYNPKTNERTILPNSTFSFPMNKISYMHSFFLTENYAVFFAYPFYYGFMEMLFGGKTVSESFKWAPEDPTRVIVVALDGSGVQEFKAPPFFCFHTIGAYEEKGHYGELPRIVMHLSESDTSNVEHPLELDAMRTPEGRDKSKAFLRVMQFEVDLSAVEVGATPLYWRPVKMEDADGVDYTGTDMPAYNMRTRGKKHCFFWGLNTFTNHSTSFYDNSVVKSNTCTGEVVAWKSKFVWVGEPVFVARPGATEEDDGAVIITALDGNAKRSDGGLGRTMFVVLDGQTMKEQARVYIPEGAGDMPFGLHAQFFGE